MLKTEYEEKNTILAKFLNITNDDKPERGTLPNHTIITPLEQLQQLEMKFYLTPKPHVCARNNTLTIDSLLMVKTQNENVSTLRYVTQIESPKVLVPAPTRSLIRVLNTVNELISTVCKQN